MTITPNFDSTAVIELQTGMKQQIPLEWPFTKQTNEEQRTELRLGEQIRFVAIPPRVLTNTGYLRVIRDINWACKYWTYLGRIIDLPSFNIFMTSLGISCHMPGSFATEQALLITEHMKAMGLLDSA